MENKPIANMTDQELKAYLSGLQKEEMELQVQIRTIEGKTAETAQQLVASINENKEYLDPDLLSIYSTISGLTNNFSNNLSEEQLTKLQEQLPLLQAKHAEYVYSIQKSNDQINALMNAHGAV